MASETTNKVITLKTCDGKTFEVEEKALLLSQTIKHMIEDDCADDVIPLPNVNARTMSKVIDYLKKHVEHDPTDMKDDDQQDELKAWDAEYMKVNTDTLYDLLLAARCLDIKGLLCLTCQTVADMIKGKTPEEIIKTLFNIKNDFTPEEEEEVRKESQWNFE